LVHARLGHELITLRVDASQAAPALGESFRATPRRDRVHWFDQATGSRVEHV